MIIFGMLLVFLCIVCRMFSLCRLMIGIFGLVRCVIVLVMVVSEVGVVVCMVFIRWWLGVFVLGFVFWLEGSLGVWSVCLYGFGLCS